MTSAELANHLQALECKYASFTNKLSLALQYGSSNLECLQNTAFIVKSNLDILRKFYSDGKLCTSCDLTATTWRIDNICGYMVSPFTTYSCYYFFSTSTFIESLVNSIWEFAENGTLTVTLQNSTVHTGTYTVVDDILYITATGFFSPVTLNFDDDCSGFLGTYDSPSTVQTVIPSFKAVTTHNNSCDWAEYCITEEEAEDLIKICYKKLSSTCNC